MPLVRDGVKFMKTKTCPNDKEFLKREYLERGKSTTYIAREFNFCVATVWRRLKKFGMVRSISEAHAKERNGMWKGDKVGYMALHDWIRDHKPKPQFCEECIVKPPFDIANISGEYHRDIQDFRWLCRSCHMKQDYKNGIRGGKHV